MCRHGPSALSWGLCIIVRPSASSLCRTHYPWAVRVVGVLSLGRTCRPRVMRIVLGQYVSSSGHTCHLQVIRVVLWSYALSSGRTHRLWAVGVVVRCWAACVAVRTALVTVRHGGPAQRGVSHPLSWVWDSCIAVVYLVVVVMSVHPPVVWH